VSSWYLWFTLEAFIPPIAKGIYGRAYMSANNKDKHNACIVKSTNGSIENRGKQSNQGVHVYGIWWISKFVVFVANSYFFGNNSLLKLFRIYIYIFNREAGI
jgi:hypothetical protein